MKKFLATAITALVSLVAMPNNADAGLHVSVGHSHTYVSGRASCGCPIYTKRVFRGYDSCRRPIYSYYRQPFRCGCKSRCSSRRHYNHGYYHHNPYYRSSHYRGRSYHNHYYRRGYSSRGRCGR